MQKNVSVNLKIDFDEVRKLLFSKYPALVLKSISDDPLGIKVVYVHNAPGAPRKEAVKRLLQHAFGESLTVKTPIVLSRKFNARDVASSMLNATFL